MASGRGGERRGLTGNGLMVPDDFVDNEVEKLLGKVGVKVCFFGQIAQAGNLLCFTRGVRRGELVVGLKGTNRFGAAESFRQHGNKRCVNIVYATAEVLQGFRGARLICHGDQSLWLLGKNIVGSI